MLRSGADSSSPTVSILLYLTIFLSSCAFTSARGVCPECEFNYTKCAWNCYGDNQKGWSPVCVDLVSPKQEATGTPPDAADFQVFPSACDAKCFLTYKGDLAQIVNITIQPGETTVPKECESLWIQEQLGRYMATKDQGLYDLGAPPPWLKQLVDNNTVVDQAELDSQYEKCLVCGATLSSPDLKPSLTSPPYSPLQSPSPVLVSPSLDVSTPAPAPMPTPAPTPAPTRAPTPAPTPVPEVASPALAPTPSSPPSPVPPTPLVSPPLAPTSSSSTVSFSLTLLLIAAPLLLL